LLVRYQHERDEAFRCELEPVAGAGETVERIMGAGIKVCVASQGALAKMRLTLALTGLEHHFPDGGRFSAEAVPRGKPFPDLFLHAASTMEVSPAECVVVEDTPTASPRRELPGCAWWAWRRTATRRRCARRTRRSSTRSPNCPRSLNLG
jgi:hypothetical protein